MNGISSKPPGQSIRQWEESSDTEMILVQLFYVTKGEGWQVAKYRERVKVLVGSLGLQLVNMSTRCSSHRRCKSEARSEMGTVTEH